MSSHERAEHIFYEALQIRPGDERDAYVASACGDDAGLLSEVATLLRAESDAGSFLAPGSASLATTRLGSPRTVVISGTQQETAGMMIGRYKLLDRLGEGGFGTVWLAEQDEPVSRRIALKVIKLGMDTRQVIARFEQERQALAMMDHPNIARVLDAGATETGRPFFVMELVNGDPITRYCDKAQLGITERLELFFQVCHAVQHAHTKGIIHRDIKPSNVLVTLQDGAAQAKIIDFGIAKATSSRLTEKTFFTEHRQLIGTLEYMSPEQAEGSQDLDTRTDVYSLGVLLYELLTGSTPFDPKQLRSAAFAEIQRIIREVEPPGPSTRISDGTRPGHWTASDLAAPIEEIARRRHTSPAHLRRALQGELDWIVMKCLEKKRARRYETVADLREDLRRLIAHEPVLAGRPSRSYRLAKLVRRHRAGFTAAAIVALAVVGGLAGTTYGLIEARRERDLKDVALVAATDASTAADASAALATQRKDAAERATSRYAAIQDFFLNQLMRAADPDISGGKSITVREIVDSAAAKAAQIADPEVEAAVRHQVGSLYLILEQLAEARAQLERALEIRGQLPAPANRPALADTSLELGRALFASGAPGRGESHLGRARDLRVALYGERSLPVAEAQYHLAEALYHLGREQEAAELNLRALETLESLAPAGHEPALLAQVLCSVAIHRSRQGQKPEAARLLERAVEIHRRADSAGSLRLASSLSDLGDVLTELNRFEEAEQRVTEALAIRRRLLPANHTMVAQAVHALGKLRNKSGHADEAEALFREALQAYRASLGEQHEYVATVNVALGSALAGQRKFEDAAQAYQDAADIYARQFPADDARLATARGLRGRCLVRLSRFAEAEPLLLDAHRVLAGSGARPDMLQITIKSLVELYTASNQPEKVDLWKKAGNPPATPSR